MVRDLRRFYTSDYLEYLRDQAKAAGNHVRFTGLISHNELANLLHQADVFVQPSVWGEPFPLSVIEAMIAGLPVVASRTGGLSESVVNGKTGLLVEPNNPVALADAMLQLLDHNGMARQMGAAGATRAKSLFSWEVIASKLTSLYQTRMFAKATARLSTVSTAARVETLERPLRLADAASDSTVQVLSGRITS